MIHLIHETSPVEVAWAAFDRSMIRLHTFYHRVGQFEDTPSDRANRMKLAQETMRLWEEWRDLFFAENTSDSAA